MWHLEEKTVRAGCNQKDVFMQSEEVFKTVRDVLVSRVLDLGFMSAHNQVGILLYGTVHLQHGCRALTPRMYP
jgi:hypothetical protein